MMTFSDMQLETMNGVTPRGLHFNTGNPCECGESADVGTRSQRKYSDSMVYKHKCRECGARWETWTEG